MAYNYWKMMDKVVVAVKAAPDNSYYGRTFNGFVSDAKDSDAIEKAKTWATEREYDREKREYTTLHEPNVHTFDNGGFTVKILKSAGGSSQGGRLSFLACEVEKDGIKFVIGVNDALLVDLIRNSTIIKGVIQEKVMFVRKGGQPGFIHEGMDAYAEANADMKKKADLKKAKKTKKWEMGGVYSTLTQTDICLGEVFDTLEEYQEEESYNSGWFYGGRRIVTKFRKRKTPVKTLAWAHFYNFHGDKELPDTFEKYLTDEIKDRTYVYFSTGTPPARTKASQLEIKESDMKLLDELLSLKAEYNSYSSQERTQGRYVREIK